MPLDPEFDRRIRALVTAGQSGGKSLNFESVYRSPQDQARAINSVSMNVNKRPASIVDYARGIPGYAAPVGGSMHQKGLAADLAGGGVGWARENAANYGIRFPESLRGTDPNHAEIDPKFWGPVQDPRDAAATAAAASAPPIKVAEIPARMGGTDVAPASTASPAPSAPRVASWNSTPTGAAQPMAQSYSGWTPESVDFAKKFGAGQMKEGIDSSPVGHWTQAIARVLQAGSGAAWNQQGMEGERAGNARVSDIYAKGLANNDPVPKIAASLMGDDFGRQEGQALAKQHMATQASQGFATRQAELGHQLQIRLMNAKGDMERKALIDKGRALGLLPPEGAAPPQPAPSAVPGTPAPIPQGVPQQSAAPVDPYQALVQPAIPRAQQEAEMRKRAGQTLMMGDPKGAAKIMNKEDDPKEYQTKDALWAERMGRAEITMRGNIGPPTNPTYNPGRTLNKFWPDDGILGMANSEKWQTYQAGAREWIAALLRKDTGAAVTETEWKLYFPTYFPQAGDTQKTQAEKLERRIAEARKLRASSGPVFDRMNPNFDQDMGQRLQQQNAAGGSPQNAGQPLAPGEYVYDPVSGQVRPK